jgi:hypothetical protein
LTKSQALHKSENKPYSPVFLACLAFGGEASKTPGPKAHSVSKYRGQGR